MKRRERSIEAGEGVPCPRCGKTSVKLVHSPGWKPENRNYYNYWYDCRNKQCKTRLFFGDSPLVLLETEEKKESQGFRALTDEEWRILFGPPWKELRPIVTGPPPWD